MRLIAAVVFAVCILAPHASLALSGMRGHCLTDGPKAAHVLASHEGPSAAAPASNGSAGHAHADSAVHADAEQAPFQVPDDENHAGMCCGLFCATGLASAPALHLSAPARAVRIAAGLDRGLAGRIPDRINRPPIA